MRLCPRCFRKIPAGKWKYEYCSQDCAEQVIHALLAQFEIQEVRVRSLQQTMGILQGDLNESSKPAEIPQAFSIKYIRQVVDGDCK